MVDFGRAGFQLFPLEFEWVEARARSLCAPTEPVSAQLWRSIA